MSTLTQSFHVVLNILVWAIRKKKKLKTYRLEKVKLYSQMIAAYIENTMESRTKKTPQNATTNN